MSSAVSLILSRYWRMVTPGVSKIQYQRLVTDTDLTSLECLLNHLDQVLITQNGLCRVGNKIERVIDIHDAGSCRRRIGQGALDDRHKK